jgi:hypothetical protein
MNVFFDTYYNTMWTAIGAMAQGFASILAILALFYSLSTFRKSLKISHYGELDRMYFELLNTSLEKLHLTNPNATRTDDQKLEYDLYAFMVWNFVETIVDRCERDKDLCSTWHPVIDAENRLHRAWLEEPRNQHKFKQSFLAFIRSEVYVPKPCARA